jgi:hypothetical protein
VDVAEALCRVVQAIEANTRAMHELRKTLVEIKDEAECMASSLAEIENHIAMKGGG